VGGCGFLGKRVVSQLLQRGDVAVRVVDVALPRDHDRDPRVTYFRGDVREKSHLLQALKGVDTCFHVASILPGCGIPERFMREVNVDGVRNSLAACAESGVRKFLYTSSATVVLDSGRRAQERLDESAPFPAQHLDLYTSTKHQAEDLVMSAHNPGGLQCCVLRPAGIYGWGDKVLADGLGTGQVRSYIGDGLSVIDCVHVDSVASGHLLAEAKLPGVASGQKYNLGNGTPVAYRVFNGYTTADKISHWGFDSPSSIPLPLVQFLAAVNELAAALIAMPVLPASLTRMAVTFTQRTWYFSIDKARTELGYEPIFGGDLKKTIAWMLANKPTSQS